MKTILPSLLLVGFAAHVRAAALDQPTHFEVAPIKFDIGGDDGHLKTIAMDAKGNLLVGVSYLAGAAKPPLADQLRAASQAGDAKAWDKALNDATRTTKTVKAYVADSGATHFAVEEFQATPGDATANLPRMIRAIQAANTKYVQAMR